MECESWRSAGYGVAARDTGKVIPVSVPDPCPAVHDGSVAWPASPKITDRGGSSIAHEKRQHHTPYSTNIYTKKTIAAAIGKHTYTRPPEANLCTGSINTLYILRRNAPPPPRRTQRILPYQDFHPDPLPSSYLLCGGFNIYVLHHSGYGDEF